MRAGLYPARRTPGGASRDRDPRYGVAAARRAGPRAAATTPARHAVPREALAGRRDERRARRGRARPRGACSHADRGARRGRATAPSPTANDSHGARLGAAPRAASVARDLGQPGVVGDDRQRAAGRRLGGDHAERLGERARDDLRLAGRQQRRELVVLEAAGRARRGRERARRPRGRPRAPVALEGVEERQQVAQRRARAALGARPACASARTRVEVAGGQRARAGARAPSR